MKKDSRTLINLIGFPLIIFLVFNGGLLFSGFVFIVSMLSIKELSDITKPKNYSINYILLYSFVIILYFFNDIVSSFDYMFILIPMIIFLCEIFRFKDNPLENISITLLGLVWIVLFLEKIVFIRNIEGGMELTFCMFFAVWSCDSAAFYFGSKFGKKKILPQISPNKTWVGTLSGLLFSILVVFLFNYYNFIHLDLKYIDIIILGTIFGGIGQLGDFFESMFKRELGIKDSSTLLRGHGGVLDRFDSLFFVIPSFYFYLICKFPII